MWVAWKLVRIVSWFELGRRGLRNKKTKSEDKEERLCKEREKYVGAKSIKSTEVNQ